MTVPNELELITEASCGQNTSEYLLARSAERKLKEPEFIRYIKRLFTNHTHSSTENHVETSVSRGEGSHTVEVDVGGQRRELIIDTGSGRTAFLCDQCTACGQHHKNPPYRLEKSTSHGHFVHCDSVTNFLDVWDNCDECVDKKCKYGQIYVEGDMWEAYKVEDYISFGKTKAFGGNIEFGCIFRQSGVFMQQSADGIMGLSIHKDSILEQLYREKVLKQRVFSQCLATDGGKLVLGGVEDLINQPKIMYTPLMKSTYQYWVVNLKSVEIDHVPLHVESSDYNQGRGCVFDSGTTFLYLPMKVKSAFLQAWEEATGGNVAPPLFRTIMHFPAVKQGLDTLPRICFHFEGGATICMKALQYYIAAGVNRYEGTISFTAQVGATILGASVLIDHNIVYDLENRQIGGATFPPLFRTIMHFPAVKQGLDTLPRICFHFEGGATICMKALQYYIAAGVNRYEGTISFTAQVGATILGASVLIDHNIVYDLENRQIGIAPANCSQISVTKSSMIKMASQSPATFRTIVSRIISSGTFTRVDQLALALLCFLILLAVSPRLMKHYECGNPTYDETFDNEQHGVNTTFVLLEETDNE
ncbi:hypothetical protein ABG067_001423 [Albugo candida]